MLWERALGGGECADAPPPGEVHRGWGGEVTDFLLLSLVAAPRPSCTSTSSRLPCLPTLQSCRFPSAQGDLLPRPTQGPPTSMTSTWTGLSKSHC